MSDPIEIMTRAMVANDNGPEGSALFSIHWREFESGYRDSAKAALAALHAAGLRIVPAEPTLEMQNRFEAKYFRSHAAGPDECVADSDPFTDAYRAMLTHTKEPSDEA